MPDQQWNEPGLTRACGLCEGTGHWQTPQGACVFKGPIVTCPDCHGTGRLPVICTPTAGMVVADRDGIWYLIQPDKGGTLFIDTGGELGFRRATPQMVLDFGYTPILPPPDPAYKPWDAFRRLSGEPMGYSYYLPLETVTIIWHTRDEPRLPIWSPLTDLRGASPPSYETHEVHMRDMQKYGVLLDWLAQEGWGDE